MNQRGLLTPGKRTPERAVPKSIERPEYVWKDDVQENIGESFIQTPETIEAMREASKIAANALALAGAAVAPAAETLCTSAVHRLCPQRWTNAIRVIPQV